MKERLPSFLPSFNQLNTNIISEEANGKTAKIVDFKLGAVSNKQTGLVVGVVYSDTPDIGDPTIVDLLNVDGCQEWPESQDIWASGPTLAACLLNHTIGYAWYQTVNITNGNDIRNCTEPGLLCECMWEDFGDMDPDKFDDAYITAQNMIDCLILDFYGPPPSGNISNQYGTNILLVDILLQGNGLGFNSAIFAEEVILGRGIPK